MNTPVLFLKATVQGHLRGRSWVPQYNRRDNSNPKDAALRAAVQHLEADAKQGDIPEHEKREDAALVAKLKQAIDAAPAEVRSRKMAHWEALEAKWREQLEMAEELGDSKRSDLYREMAESASEKRRALAVAHAKFIEHGDGMELRHKDGRSWAVFLPDASNPGKYRYQIFDADGFRSHSTHDTPEDAVDDAATSGYQDHDPGALDRVSGTKRWEKGQRISAVIQANNGGQLSWEATVREINAINDEYKDLDMSKAHRVLFMRRAA